MQPSALVTLHVWGVATRRVPRALLRMATDRGSLSRTPGLTFGRLLGTSAGDTFTPADADPHHWALLASWRSAEDAEAFEESPVALGWSAIARERLRVRMRPLGSRGRWSGRAPFAPTALPPTALLQPVAAERSGGGLVASVTRARLAPRHTPAFVRASRHVAEDLRSSEGLVMAFGFGEYPVLSPGTFSVWQSAQDLRRFAERAPAHADAVRRRAVERWYAEELFATLAVLSLDGTRTVR